MIRTTNSRLTALLGSLLLVRQRPFPCLCHCGTRGSDSLALAGSLELSVLIISQALPCCPCQVSRILSSSLSETLGLLLLPRQQTSVRPASAASQAIGACSQSIYDHFDAVAGLAMLHGRARPVSSTECSAPD